MPSALKLNDSLLSVSNTMLTTPIPAPSEKTWQLQNSPKSGQTYTTDWFKATSCQWAHAIAGSTIIARTKELIEDGYLDDYGRLTGAPSGTTLLRGLGGGLAGFIDAYGAYYNGRTLVFEVDTGTLGLANTLNFSGWNNPVTLNRVLDVMDTGNGTQTLFTLAASTGQAAGTTAGQLRVWIDDVRQTAGTDYTVADNADTTSLDVTFTTAPDDGAVIRFMSVRKELTITDIADASGNAWAALSIGDVDQIVGLGCSFFDKEHEDDVYDSLNNPWKMIHPGIREYQDHADVVRSLDWQNRIMINDATSFSEFGQIDSYGWGGADVAKPGINTVDETYLVRQLKVKSGCAFRAIASYCEQYNKVLWYHMPAMMLSPIRKCMYCDHTGTGASLGWFSSQWINIDSVQIETQPENGWITLDLDKERFEYNPYDDGGRGADARLWNYESGTGDGSTTAFVLAGQTGRDDLAVYFDPLYGGSATPLVEGVDYTLSHGASDLTVNFTTAPGSGATIHFYMESHTEYFTFSAEDPHDSNTRYSFVVPIYVANRTSGSAIMYVWLNLGEMWAISDITSTPAADNNAWFTAPHRWQEEARRVVQELITSGYSQSRELIFEVANEVWNTATEFERDTTYINGIGSNAYGLSSKAGLGILTGFIRKYVEEEMVLQSVNYDLTWAAAAQHSDSGSSYNRYIGHEYFWENIAGLSASAATAKNAKFQCFTTMYYGNGFKDNASQNCTGLAGQSHVDQVLAWLHTSEQTMEDAYMAWFEGPNTTIATIAYNLDRVALHKSNAESAGSIFRGFYEGGSGENVATGLKYTEFDGDGVTTDFTMVDDAGRTDVHVYSRQGDEYVEGVDYELSDSGSDLVVSFYTAPSSSKDIRIDTIFAPWWNAEWTGDFGARMWRAQCDALLALYPTIMLSHYGSTQDAVYTNPWHTGPWELGDTALFAAMRDEYGTGFIG